MRVLGRWGSLLCGAAMLVAVAGCGGVAAYKPDGAVTTSQLEQDKKALALMILADDSRCTSVAATLGRRQGDGYWYVAGIAGTDVTEIELDPGEYHIVFHGCTYMKYGSPTPLKNTIVFENLGEGGLGYFHKSLASFRVEAGEIVNVGRFYVVPMAYNLANFKVEDWRPHELERFRKARPTLAAQMKTRLMTVTKPPPPATK